VSVLYLKFLGSFSKFEKRQLVSSYLCVRPSIHLKHAAIEQIQVSLKSDKDNGSFT